ncbi:MAG: discoidin domain-containing protein, partial [Gemmatimonadota bacterium]|nr:discoidin domain-containing protein [Gemmatimonadota bacterium]
MRITRSAFALVALHLAIAVGQVQAQPTTSIAPPRILDRFETTAGWGAFPSEGVSLKLLGSRGVTGRALSMDFDFGGKAGYAIARKAFAVGTPLGNWSFSFRARGDMRPNTLEFKLLDRNRENVWWYTIANYQPTQGWSTVAVRQRQVSFAWGPVGGGPPRDIAFIEIVVTAGSGGHGLLSIDDLTFTALPADIAATTISSVVASGTLPNSQAAFAIDSDSLTSWQASAPAVGRTNGHAPTLTLDLGGVRTYGGIVIDWGVGQQASTVVVDSSNSGTNWVEAGRLIGVRGGRSYLPLTEGSSRFLRVTLMNGAPAGGVY